MAEGLGFKTFTTGEVLTAGDVNGYLMQGVLVFADGTARDAAITSPEEGQFAYLKSDNKLYYYTGATWAEADTSGIQPSEFAAKGDLLAGTGSATFDNLTVGANDTVLTADSSTATGLKWAAPAAGGGGGLTFIKSETIGSAVSSVTVTGAFSATYDNYLITTNSGVASTTVDLKLTLGGTTSDYYWSGIYMSYSSTTVNGENKNNVNHFQAGDGTTNTLNVYCNIQNPNLAKRTHFSANFARSLTTGVQRTYQGFLDNATQYTDFTLTTSSGTMTGGTIRVYGYQNS
jgi:hypothetical protein